MLDALPPRSEPRPAPIFSLAPFGESEPLVAVDANGKIVISDRYGARLTLNL